MTNNIILLITPFVAGILLGIFFFGGLWWTTRIIVTTKKPALIFITSAILRFGTVLLGFYFISNHNWRKILACLIGFMITKFFIKQRTKAIEQI